MRKIIIILSCCIVLLLLGYAGYRGYKVWKQTHGIAMAKAYIAKDDVRNTILSLQGVLKANPRNVEACRMMAGLTEMARSSAAVVWRQRVLELNPGSLEDRLLLAQSALIFHDFTLATNTLAGVADADKNTFNYQNIAGTVALQGGQPDQAEAHFSEAIRLDPSNIVPQINLAVVRLHQTNSLDMAEARIALQRVIINSTNVALRSQARRELTLDAIRFNDISNALTLSKELTEQTNAIFPDKLLRLGVLQKTKSKEFKPTLDLYRSEAATDPAKLYDLVSWQQSQLSPAETLGWLQSLPISTRTNQPAALLVAQCQLQLGDWHGLQTTIQSQNWGQQLEFKRHALLARALREQNLMSTSATEWGVALSSAGNQKGSVIELFNLAAAWNWNNEAEQILWIVVNRYPDEKWAPTVLSQALMGWHRTRSLMELFNIVAKRNPDDLEVQNNLAMAAMLLDAQELRPYDLAKKVYEKSPKNPSCVSTYAFSLYLQGKNTEALKVMQQLAPMNLEEPSNALYYGIILKANGKKSEAKASLSRITTAQKAQLMPEEQALFDKAMAGL